MDEGSGEGEGFEVLWNIALENGKRDGGFVAEYLAEVLKGDLGKLLGFLEVLFEGRVYY